MPQIQKGLNPDAPKPDDKSSPLPLSSLGVAKILGNQPLKMG
ncbi:MAG: hypothetical protein ACFB0G_06500 [Leptolyngbyaceae cyanobacterium]